MDDATNNHAMPPEKSSGAGSLITAIVVLAVIVGGVFYFWSERGDEAGLMTEDTDQAVESINAQSSSDTEASIEDDLDSTDIENVDYELNDINAS